MIAPMKRVSIVCMKEDRDRLLTTLQHSALVMILPSDDGVLGDDTESGEYQRRSEQVIKELNRYSKKKGLFAEASEILEEDFEKLKEERFEVLRDFEEALLKKDSLLIERNALRDKISAIFEWVELEANIEELGKTNYSYITLGRIPTPLFEAFKEESKNECLSYETVSTDEKFSRILISYLLEDDGEIKDHLLKFSFEEVQLPIKSGTVKENKASLDKRLLEVESEIEKITQTLCEKSSSLKGEVETLFEQSRARNERSDVRLLNTKETVFVDGWVRADSVEKLESEIKKQTSVYSTSYRDPFDDEEVPTSLDNNKTVSQFEGITEMFNPPKYGDFDPNAVMAPWYWIIFGMMMGDAGYGLMMAVFILLGKRLLHPKGGTLKLMNVMLYSSVTTIIFGVLFGSYFGEELFPALLPFTAMGDPIKMLLLTIIVGVLHIFTGMITKMVIDCKNGRVLDAIFDQLSWMMIIAGVGMVFIPPLSSVGVIIAIVGALVVLFTAGRHKKGVVGKVVGGLGGLYNITSYFSDILSYSRILALSLATGVVGMVMNMLAGMVQGSVIGFILSLLIYAVGHVFNLVLGLLSAYVHSCRLQYIEFYGKFYEGGGTMFRPFEIKTNYINIKKD